ncbi:hypothetical protein ACJJI4_11555 [Microbulbifer sp. TRSA002]|uniref:hypothetical protein n=1 Tax=Microbulbifer sp. TRSA002 TaxID=3243382 RepID=UPI00403A1B72
MPLLPSCAGERFGDYNLTQQAIEKSRDCGLEYQRTPSQDFPTTLSLVETCTDRIDRELIGYFRGNLAIAPEIHTFEPCNIQLLQAQTDRVIKPKSIWFSSQPDIEVADWSRHFLIAKGELHGPGRYGHFGTYSYLFVATEIIHITNNTNSNCEPHFYNIDEQLEHTKPAAPNPLDKTRPPAEQ